MVEQAGSPAYEAESSLADSRAQFVGSLGRRLEALRAALAALEQSPRSSTHRDHLRRRIHAFGAAAGVLGFERVFEAFRQAEVVLGSTGPSSLGSAELGLVARTVDLVPSLVLGAGGTPSSRPPAFERRTGYPTSVLVFGAAPLAESLVAAASSGGASLECERTEDATRAEEIVRVTAPDVAVIDADRAGARALMETLTYDPLLDPVRIVAVGTFDRPEAAADLVSLGVARVLPKPVSPEALKRSVLEVAGERGPGPDRVEPIGDVTVEALAERLAQELRRGLVESLKPQGRGVTVALGDGTDVLAAAWSSVARIRELVTLRSGGEVRFEATGPEGAVPLAPWMGDERPRTTGTGERRSSEGVSLAGRIIVVADDDPSVVWFLSGLFRAAGAEVLEAHDGRRALSLVRREWPDVVVSDILMPELDGFALCREIKRDVALSDTPVVLLSWKEDLLQRVRELGADADGYLRKEATASTVVQRIREVLLPRARVEARVAAGTLARGRLDGLTPRLILDVLCRNDQNAHLTVRDAAFLYEVDVRNGRVRTATRTASDGRAETGERALSTLLGVRAGRFAVRRDVSECPTDWDRDLKDLLATPIERARAARGLLSDPRRVARVEMDATALEPYLAATPMSVRETAERLSDGESPENILHSGVSSALLESVLIDAVLHGAVTRLVGRNGDDLLAKEVLAEQNLRAAFARELPKPAAAPTPLPALADLVPRPDEPPDSPLAAVVSDERSQGGEAGPEEPRMVPRPGEEPVPSPLQAVLSPAPADVIIPAPSAAFAASAPTTPGFQSSLGPSIPEPPPSDSFAGEGFETLLVDSNPPPMDPDRSPSAKPKAFAPILSAPPELSPLESALLSVAAPTSARSRFTSSVPPPSSERDETRAGPPLARPGQGAEQGPVIIGAPERQPSLDEPGVDLGTAVAAVGETPGAPPKAAAAPAAAPEAPVAEAAPEDPAPESGRRPTAQSVPQEAGETPRDGARAEALAKASTGPIPLEVTTRVDESGASEVPIALETRKDVLSRGDTKPSALAVPEESEPKKDLTPSSSATQKSAATGSGSRKHETGQQTRRVVRGPSLPGKPRGDAAPKEGGAGGTLGIAAVVTIAAFSSFSIVRAIRGVPEALPEPAPPLVVSVPEPSAAPVGSAPLPPLSIAVRDMDLPAGLSVDADRGLLEIEIDAAQNLHVDGVLIGPGPFRQVPLREGMHTLRIEGSGVDLSRPVEIRKGRRVRVGLSR